MESTDLIEVRRKLGLTQQQFADMVGITRGTVIDYERGMRRSDRREAPIPKAVELACAALELGITSYGEGALRGHRAEDRAYVNWAAEQLLKSPGALEEQARKDFPETWGAYPYALIALPEWDDPDTAREVMERAREAGIQAEWQVLPVAREQSRDWLLNVLVVVTPTMDDAFKFKMFNF